MSLDWENLYTTTTMAKEKNDKNFGVISYDFII